MRLDVVFTEAFIDKLAAFENHYGDGTSILVLGPYAGQLSNNAAHIILQQPDAPPAGDPNTTPGILVDEVVYDDVWYPVTDGTRSSLYRSDLLAVGSDQQNWNAAVPNPGSADGNCGDCIAPKELPSLPRPFSSSMIPPKRLDSIQVQTWSALERSTKRLNQNYLTVGELTIAGGLDEFAASHFENTKVQKGVPAFISAFSRDHDAQQKQIPVEDLVSIMDDETFQADFGFRK